MIGVVVDPGSCLVDVRHSSGLLAGLGPSGRRKPLVSIVVVGVVGVVEGFLDWTAFGMQYEVGINCVVESIAVKLTYGSEDCPLLDMSILKKTFIYTSAAQAVRPGVLRLKIYQYLSDSG